MTRTSPSEARTEFSKLKTVMLNTGELSLNEVVMAYFTRQISDLYQVDQTAIEALALLLSSNNASRKQELLLNWRELFKKSGLLTLAPDGGVMLDPEAEKVAMAMLKGIFKGGKFLTNPLPLGHVLAPLTEKLMRSK